MNLLQREQRPRHPGWFAGLSTGAVCPEEEKAAGKERLARSEPLSSFTVGSA